MKASVSATKTRLKKYVEVLEGKSASDRRKIITKTLIALGYRFVEETHLLPHVGEITNIIVQNGDSKKLAVLGAHYDAIGRGANDNASGVAVLLGVLEALRSDPILPRLEFVFFDAEENLCLGSRFYLENEKARRSVLSATAYVLDGVGKGDVVLAAEYLRGGREVISLDFVPNSVSTTLNSYNKLDIHMPMSDCLSFMMKGWRTYHITAIEKEELLDWVVNSKMPRTWEVAHTESDSAKAVREESLRMTMDYVVKLVRSLDRRR